MEIRCPNQKALLRYQYQMKNKLRFDMYLSNLSDLCCYHKSKKYSEILDISQSNDIINFFSTNSLLEKILSSKKNLLQLLCFQENFLINLS